MGEICTGSRAQDWPDLRRSIDPQHIEQLRSIYRHVDDIDLYVGGFLEAAHEDSILGPVFKCIIGDQFARLKKGDRFFYDLGLDENIAFSLSQLNEVKINRNSWSLTLNLVVFRCGRPPWQELSVITLTMLTPYSRWLSRCQPPAPTRSDPARRTQFP